MRQKLKARRGGGGGGGGAGAGAGPSSSHPPVSGVKRKAAESDVLAEEGEGKKRRKVEGRGDPGDPREQGFTLIWYAYVFPSHVCCPHTSYFSQNSKRIRLPIVLNDLNNVQAYDPPLREAVREGTHPDA